MSFIKTILVGHVIHYGRKSYNGRHACLTKENNLSLLQSAMDSYYKLRQLFYYKVQHGLLQVTTGITKGDGFITNCDSTLGISN